MIYHTSLAALHAGFVGGGLSFVISGCLITRILFEKIASGRFSLAGVLGRRVRYIHPALIAVMLCSLIAGYFLLFADQYEQRGVISPAARSLP